MIISSDNPRVKRLRKLSRQKKARSKERAFLIEGKKLVLEAIDSGIVVNEIFVGATTAGAQLMMDDFGKLEPTMISEELLAECAQTTSPQPVVAIGSMPNWQVGALGEPEGNHILVLDEIRDPGNLGTIIRSAEAAGAQGIVLTGDCVELFSPKVVRSAAGSLFRIPTVVEPDTVAGIKALKEQGWKTVATVVDDGATNYLDADLAGSAIVLGNEARGLGMKAIAACDATTTIDSPGPTESLNLAAAAAVLSFEALRQRKGKAK